MGIISSEAAEGRCHDESACGRLCHPSCTRRTPSSLPMTSQPLALRQRDPLWFRSKRWRQGKSGYERSSPSGRYPASDVAVQVTHACSVRGGWWHYETAFKWMWRSQLDSNIFERRYRCLVIWRASYVHLTTLIYQFESVIRSWVESGRYSQVSSHAELYAHYAHAFGDSYCRGREGERGKERLTRASRGAPFYIASLCEWMPPFKRKLGQKD